MKDILKQVAVVLAVLLFLAVAYFLYDTLTPMSHEEKLAQIIHLEDSRQLTDQLTAYVSDTSAELRRQAALAVGRIDHDSSAAILHDLLADSSLDVASTAAFAIGLTGDKDYAARLLDGAWDMPASLASRAIVSAGRLADTSMADVAEALSAFLTHPAPEVRVAACYGLFYAGARSHAPGLMALIATEPDPEVQEAILSTLSRFGTPEAGEVYKRYLADSDPYMRSLAVRGLGRSTVADASQLIAVALNDRDARVVVEAIRALSRQTEDATVPRRLSEKLQQETDQKIILEIIGALQRLESDRGVSAVLALFNGEIDDNILAAALPYLAAVQKGRAMGVIDSVLNEPRSPIVRAAGAEAYAEVGDPGVVSRLGVTFGDEDPMVRAAAFDALTKLDSANIDYYLNKALNDPDYMPAILALDNIGQAQRKAYLPVMQTMMSRGDAIDVDLRRSIIDAIDNFVQPTGNDSVVMQILIDGILDHNYIVRKRAAEIYRDKLNENRFNMVPPVRTSLTAGDIESGVAKYGPANPYAIILTARGSIEIELFFDAAPLTVLSFIRLAEEGFYGGLIFHRVVPDFVIQGGDPRGDGWGGPGDYIRCEYSEKPFLRGTVGIATSGKDTGGSQFFITHSPQPHLNARYTVFGQVIEGMEVVDQIERGDVIQSVMIRDMAK